MNKKKTSIQIGIQASLYSICFQCEFVNIIINDNENSRVHIITSVLLKVKLGFLSLRFHDSHLCNTRQLLKIR